MNLWDKWVRHPQALWPRKALFQVHLWTGVGLGLYILMMSVSGCALIYRREITRQFALQPLAVSGPRWTEAELRTAAEHAHPGYQVQQIFEPTRRNAATRPVEIWLVQDGGKLLQRYFNPYTGEDLGPVLPTGLRVFNWVADLHANLLLGMRGLFVNGLGGILTTVMCLTGAVIWWPGSEKWKRSLLVEWRANPKRMNWTLHSALGFWAFAFVLMWGISGIYLAFPAPFQWIADRVTPANQDSRYFFAGDQALAWLAKLHFGRFSGLGVELVWTAFGLVPVALFITGAIMWWNRVLGPWMRRVSAAEGTGTAGVKAGAA